MIVIKVKDLRAWCDAADSDEAEVSVAVMGERGTRRIVSLGLRTDGPVLIVAEDMTPFGLPASYTGPPWKCDECLQGENTGPLCINCGGPPPPVRERRWKVTQINHRQWGLRRTFDG